MMASRFSLKQMAKLNSLFFVAFMMPLYGHAQDYTAARDKSLEAAYIQTGAKQLTTDFKTYFMRKGKRYAQDLGVYKPGAFLLGAYGLYNNPSYSFNLDSNKKLTIAPYQATLEIKIW